MTHNQILGCGFVACIAFTMPDQLKKYKLTSSKKKKKKKKREERKEKWKSFQVEAKAQAESQ